MSQKLSDDQIQASLKALPGWSGSPDGLEKSFAFKNFREAMGFLVRVGFEAEEQGHHPEISNVYKHVTLRLRTHDADDQVTEKDVALAKAIEKLLA